MKTPRYDEQEVTSSFFRHIPALAWLALFAVFAVGGALSRDEPRQMADLAITSQLEASESAGVSPAWQDAAVVRDAAVTAHEELDPAGVGLNSTL